METQQSEIKALQRQVKMLLAEVKSLRQENAELRFENAELRRQLKQDSHNSHKAPSSDGIKKRKKPQKPGLAKEKKAKGGQQGHQGKTLEQVSTEKVSKVVKHKPEGCQSCGRQFVEQELTLRSRRQLFDLPAVSLQVYEHQVYAAKCCGQLQRGSYPAEVKQAVQYGSGVRAWVNVLSVDYRLPIERISQLFTDLKE